MKRALGNWVVDDSFWDREKELGLLIEYLEHGANILLTAPRRIGKTSLMREAERQLAGKYVCLQVDLQKAHSAADAIVELSIATRPYLAIWKKITGLFSSVLDKVAGSVESLRLDQLTVTLRSGVSVADWQAKGDRLFEALAESEKPVVVFLDEVPILVNRLLQGDDYQLTPQRRQETDAFMSWLRDNSIRHQGKVRIVVTGSIGLEPILHLAGLNATLNTFTPFPLGPWSDAVAREFVRAAAKEYGITLRNEADLTVVEELGYCIPHHVQVFFDRIYRHCRLTETSEVTPALVREVYQIDMLGVQGHAELSHLEERLKMVLGPALFPLALQLLTEAAMTGTLSIEAARATSAEYPVEGKASDEVLREILAILEHDGYLKLTSPHLYRFMSKLVQDWWRARFGFTYRRTLRSEGESQ